MQTDRVADALRRFVVGPDEPVEREWVTPNAVTLQTPRYLYRAAPADWLISGAVWVDAAIRVLAESDRGDLVPTFGLLFAGPGDPIYLNEVAAMAGLGRRLHTDLDPVAYAELLAELHFPTGPEDQPVSRPTVVGKLILDAAQFAARFPFVPAEVLAARPHAMHAGGRITLTFQSYVRYLLPDFGSALDIYDWTVAAADGEPATWTRILAAERLEIRG